jgi:putative ABC transport system permease protein
MCSGMTNKPPRQALFLFVIALVWNAIRWRRSQAVAVCALTLLAVAAAAATPWYALATQEALVRGRVAAAVPDQRVLSATYRPDRAADVKAVPDLIGVVDNELRGLPSERRYGQISVQGNARLTTGNAAVSMAARDEVCEHSIVDGRCPAAPNEILVGRSMEDQLNGTVVPFTVEDVPQPFPVTIVGHYRPADPQDPFWSGVFGNSAASVEPVFTVPQSITALEGVRQRTTVDTVLAPSAYTEDLPERVDIASDALQSEQVVLRTQATDLAKLINDDRSHLADGLAVAAGRLVLLCGFALFLAIRHTTTAGRRDLGLIRLRGVRRWRTWFVMVAPTVLPMLGGAIVGAGLGLLGARLLAGPVKDSGHLQLALLGVAAAVVAVVVGALIIAAVAQSQASRTDVNDLLRATPAAAHRRRAVDIVEIVVLLLAAVGVWQLIAVAESRIGTIAPAAAPALLALAAGLIVSRLLLKVATLAGNWALRVGRLPVALAALSACRRPALRWTVTLVVVAVAGLAGAVADYQRAQPALADRAVQENGAAQVLTVSAPSRIVLRDTVRKLDPDGKYAMAVASFPRPAGLTTGVLAVDSARLGKVALWRSEYGPLPSLAKPDPQADSDRTALKTGVLTLTAFEDPVLRKDGRMGATPDSGGPAPVSPGIIIVATLVNQEGRTETVRFGPLAAGRQAYQSHVERCDTGCRLVSLSMLDHKLTPGGFSDLPVSWGTRVRFESLRQNGKDVVSVGRFADRLRWRAQTSQGALPPELSGGPQGLELTVPPGCPGGDRGNCQPTISPVSAPVPLPVVLAGYAYYGSRVQDARLSLLGAPDVPVRVVGDVKVLPRLGAMGVIVDLSDLDTLVAKQVDGEQLQVWLTDDAPPSIVDDLAKAGVQTLDRRNLAQLRTSYTHDAPAAVREFALLAAALGLIIAVVALMLSASAGRAATVGDLVALRAQGLSQPVVRRVGLAGYGWPAFTAAAVGLAVAGLSGALPVPPPAVFADRWHLISPPPGGVHWPVIVAVGLVSAVVIGLAAIWATRRLTRAVATRAVNGGAR